MRRNQEVPIEICSRALVGFIRIVKYQCMVKKYFKLS